MDLENINAINSDLIRGHINTIVLNILYENDRYGYEILQQIELKSNGQYTIKQPTLYSALKRLEQLDFVTSYWGKGMSNGGRRKYFQITDKGREFVQQNRAEWEYSRTIIDNLVSDKIFDFDSTTPPANIDFSALKKRQPKKVQNAEDIEDNADSFNPSLTNMTGTAATSATTTPTIPTTPTATTETTATTAMDTGTTTTSCQPSIATINNNTMATTTVASMHINNDIDNSQLLQGNTATMPTIDSDIPSTTYNQDVAKQNVHTAFVSAHGVDPNGESVATSFSPSVESVAAIINDKAEYITKQEEQQKVEMQTIYSVLEQIDCLPERQKEQTPTHIANTTMPQDVTTAKIADASSTFTTQTAVVEHANPPYFNTQKTVNQTTVKTWRDEKLERERARQMHENYLKLIGDQEALQTHYIYTMLENENPAFNTQSKPFYADKSLAIDYYNTPIALEDVPYTIDTVFASSFRDASNYLDSSVHADEFKESVLEQLSPHYFQEREKQQTPPKSTPADVDKYTDFATADTLYKNLQEEVTENSKDKMDSDNFIHKLIEDEALSNTKKVKPAKSRIILKGTSNSKLFVILSSILFVLALAECLAIFFIGGKYNIGYQYPLAVAILFTIGYIFSTVFATRENFDDNLTYIASKKFMWYMVLAYFIAMIISVITLFLLTKTFENTVGTDFWFYTISFNTLTFNMPLLCILYTTFMHLKESTKKDTL